MKRTIVLRIESEGGFKEEYEFPTLDWGQNVLDDIFNEEIDYLPKQVANEILLKIIRNSSDERLIMHAFCVLKVNLTSNELCRLFEKHKKSEDVQFGIVMYAMRLKYNRRILQKIQKETEYDVIRREATSLLL